MALAKNGEGHRQGLRARKRSLGEVERAASSGETATTTFEPMARIGCSCLLPRARAKVASGDRYKPSASSDEMVPSAPSLGQSLQHKRTPNGRFFFSSSSVRSTTRDCLGNSSRKLEEKGTGKRFPPPASHLGGPDQPSTASGRGHCRVVHTHTPPPLWRWSALSSRSRCRQTPAPCRRRCRC
jgi:hypothetical protein